MVSGLIMNPISNYIAKACMAYSGIYANADYFC